MLKSLPFFAFVFCIAGNSFAQTNISGQIRSNTTWTKAGSPYILQRDIEIAPDVTLSIEPGVIVKNVDKIKVYGTVKAIGTANDPIEIIPAIKSTSPYVFWLENWKTSDTMVFDYCSFHMATQSLYSTTALYCYESVNMVITNSSFQKANVKLGNKYTNASVKVSNCTFEDCALEIERYAIATVENNTITTGHSKFSGAKQVYIRNNVFNGGKGVSCTSEMLVFENNTVVNMTSEKALDLNWSEMDLDLPFTGNVIAHNSGIGLNNNSTGGTFTGNSIYDNKIGIKHSFYPTHQQATYKNNCVYNNKDYNFYNISGAAYHIAENWWGTTDSAKIERMIYDNVDDFKSGRVSFLPLLPGSHTSCKTYTPPATDIENINSTKADVSVYPNPFNSTIHIKATGKNDIQKVELYNLVGKKIQEVNSNDKNISLATGNLAPGIYLYRVTLSDNTILTNKVIKR